MKFKDFSLRQWGCRVRSFGLCSLTGDNQRFGGMYSSTFYPEYWGEYHNQVTEASFLVFIHNYGPIFT
jgi:hypothetical protein